MASIANPCSSAIPQNPSSSSHKKVPCLPVALLSQNLQTTLKIPTLDPKLIISGPSRLSGHVQISGSKNSALAILAGTLCCSGTSILRRIPDLSDTRSMISILRSLGARVEISDGEMAVDTEGICSLEPCEDSVGKIRAGFFVLGPLLARFGEAIVTLPGGCDIGTRPIDIYLDGLRALGAIVELRYGKVHACVANGRGLTGGSFHLSYPSVGATETLMMAGSIADGVTVLTNVAQEPEVTDLARFLIASGATVEGVGTRKLVIKGRKWLHSAEFTIIPDRIEAGTFMAAAAITRSCISLSPVIPHHLTCIMDKLSAAGCQITQRGSHVLEVSAVPAMTGDDLQGFCFKTGPYPGFPTDLQPQFMALLATCSGAFVVDETVFDGRMCHVREMQKLGARIRVCGNSALVYGKLQGSSFCGSNVVASDLRSGASLVLAAMAAKGITEIQGVAHIDRGYENLETKLHCLGVDVWRESEFLCGGCTAIK